MMDIEDYPISMKENPVKNIEILKKMIHDLYNVFDDSKRQSDCKKQITKQYHKLSNSYSKQYKIKVKKLLISKYRTNLFNKSVIYISKVTFGQLFKKSSLK